MRIGIVGAGALGGLYGALLARQGYEVHFLMRRDYEIVRQKGLSVHSYKGDFHLANVNCYRSPAEIGPVDLVFIGLKTTANHCYEELISPLVKEDTLVLSAQNGLGNEEQLAELFGAQRVAGGLAFLCCNRQEPGVIRFLDYGYIHIGNYQRPPDDRLNRFARMMRASDVECTVVDDLALSRWKKLVWNVPFNCMTALLNISVDKIMGDRNLRQRSLRLMKEVQGAARAHGLIIIDEFLDQMMENSDKMKPYFTSMHLDRLAQRPMEIESILGEPLRRGLAKGLALPEMQQLYDALSELDVKEGT